MKTEDIKQLIQKYYDGNTSLEEEDLLREYFSKEENKKTDPEFAEIIRLFSEYHRLELGEEKQSSDKSGSPKNRIYAFSWYYSVAASVAFLLVGIFLGSHYMLSKESDGQIVQLSAEIQEMKNMMTYQQVKNLTPSERIQMTYEVQQLDSTDYESIDVLIDLMFFDDNTNVRLAATDALARFTKSEKVRHSFIDALKKEKDPVVQIELIDALVKSKEKKALPELQKIMGSEDQNSTVKQRAALGISQLI